MDKTILITLVLLLGAAMLALIWGWHIINKDIKRMEVEIHKMFFNRYKIKTQIKRE